MGVAVHTSTKSFEIGSGDFLIAFFDTISVRLTRGLFGKKFPIILDEFYEGQLSYDHLDRAYEELNSIKHLLKKYPPTKVVWDKTNPSLQPPWGDDISDNITDLSNYFVTSEGKDLFSVLFEAIDYAKQEQSDLIIR